MPRTIDATNIAARTYNAHTHKHTNEINQSIAQMDRQTIDAKLSQSVTDARAVGVGFFEHVRRQYERAYEIRLRSGNERVLIRVGKSSMSLIVAYSALHTQQQQSNNFFFFNACQ